MAEDGENGYLFEKEEQEAKSKTTSAVKEVAPAKAPPAKKKRVLSEKQLDALRRGREKSLEVRKAKRALKAAGKASKHHKEVEEATAALEARSAAKKAEYAAAKQRIRLEIKEEESREKSAAEAKKAERAALKEELRKELSLEKQLKAQDTKAPSSKPPPMKVTTKPAPPPEPLAPPKPTRWSARLKKYVHA